MATEMIDRGGLSKSDHVWSKEYYNTHPCKSIFARTFIDIIHSPALYPNHPTSTWNLCLKPQTVLLRLWKPAKMSPLPINFLTLLVECIFWYSYQVKAHLKTSIYVPGAYQRSYSPHVTWYSWYSNTHAQPRLLESQCEKLHCFKNTVLPLLQTKSPLWL